MPGGAKLLLELGDATVIRRVVSTAFAARLDPVVVVVGRDADGVRAALDGLSVRFATVSSEAEGRLTSVVTGIEALPEARTEGVVILLGDEPGLRADHVRAVLGAMDPRAPRALRASYTDRPGHPVFLPPIVVRAVPDLARDHDPETGLWDLIEGSGTPHAHLPIDEAAPIDIDTAADLARVVAGQGGSR